MVSGKRDYFNNQELCMPRPRPQRKLQMRAKLPHQIWIKNLCLNSITQMVVTQITLK